MSTRIDAHLARLKARGWEWPIAWDAVELIGRKEDCRLVAYLCPAGVWTIGWGETDGVTPDMRWTEDQADARFLQQLRKRAARVEARCTLPPNANQLGAMTSLNYNIGDEGFARSTVLKRHNAGDFDAAARAFALWNKARVDGVLQVLNGLTLRRAEEARLYLTPVEGAPAPRMPQAVDGESNMAASPINRSAAVVGAGGLAMAGQALEQGKAIADQVAEFVGLPVPALIAGVLVIAAIVIATQRKKQRDGGWA